MSDPKTVDMDNFPINKFDYVVLAYNAVKPVRTKFIGLKYFKFLGYYADFGENISVQVTCENNVIILPVYLAQNQNKQGFLRIFDKEKTNE